MIRKTKTFSVFQFSLIYLAILGFVNTFYKSELFIEINVEIKPGKCFKKVLITIKN